MKTTGLVYKYVDQNGAIRMASDGTLKYTAPNALNDPFDLFIEDLMNYDHKEIRRRRLKIYLDFIRSNPFDYFINFHSGINSWLLQRDIGRFSYSLNKLEEREYLDLIEDVSNKLDMNLPFDIPESDNSKIIDPISNCGVFCATRNIRSLLMWSHYAQGHRGAIIGISAECIHKDAPLMAVNYSNKRASFYDTVTECTLTKRSDIDYAVNTFTERALLSKSAEWSYEEEIRSVMLNINCNQRYFYLHKVDFSMIKEIYIGVKADDGFIGEIKSLAKDRNRDCQIFKAGMERYSYDLTFTPT